MAGSPWTAASRQRAIEQALERVAAGESLRSVSRDEQMPPLTTLNLWLNSGEHVEQYTRAREERADAIFEEMFDIADDSSSDMVANEDGIERLNSEHVQRSKLRIDTRKWALSKMQPKKYGDKLDLNHGGHDGGPVEVEHKIDAIGELGGFLERLAKSS